MYDWMDAQLSGVLWSEHFRWERAAVEKELQSRFGNEMMDQRASLKCLMRHTIMAGPGIHVEEA